MCSIVSTLAWLQLLACTGYGDSLVIARHAASLTHVSGPNSSNSETVDTISIKVKVQSQKEILIYHYTCI